MSFTIVSLLTGGIANTEYDAREIALLRATSMKLKYENFRIESIRKQNKINSQEESAYVPYSLLCCTIVPSIGCFVCPKTFFNDVFDFVFCNVLGMDTWCHAGGCYC